MAWSITTKRCTSPNSFFDSKKWYWSRDRLARSKTNRILYRRKIELSSRWSHDLVIGVLAQLEIIRFQYATCTTRSHCDTPTTMMLQCVPLVLRPVRRSVTHHFFSEQATCHFLWLVFARRRRINQFPLH
jgi:hypothetical protein